MLWGRLRTRPVVQFLRLLQRCQVHVSPRNMHCSPFAVRSLLALAHSQEAGGEPAAPQRAPPPAFRPPDIIRGPAPCARSRTWSRGSSSSWQPHRSADDVWGPRRTLVLFLALVTDGAGCEQNTRVRVRLVTVRCYEIKEREMTKNPQIFILSVQFWNITIHIVWF